MRITGAQRAHDHVVLLGRVLDHHHVLALAAGIVELGDGRGRVLQQPRVIGRIAQAFATTRAPLRGPIFFS